MRAKIVPPLTVRLGRVALFAAIAPMLVEVGRVYAQASADAPRSDDAPSATSSSPPQKPAAVDKSAYEITKGALADTLITVKLKAALYENKATSGQAIHVMTHEGVVTLWGDVPNADTAKHAVELARSTNGVQGVISMLQFKASNG